MSTRGKSRPSGEEGEARARANEDGLARAGCSPGGPSIPCQLHWDLRDPVASSRDLRLGRADDSNFRRPLPLSLSL